MFYATQGSSRYGPSLNVMVNSVSCIDTTSMSAHWLGLAIVLAQDTHDCFKTLFIMLPTMAQVKFDL